MLYKAISKHANPRDIYLDKLIKENIISKAEEKAHEKEFSDLLQGRLDEAKQIEKATVTQFLKRTWEGFEYR